MNWQGDIIFEGAQGLQLDMNHDNFPYVTPSNTGVQNVISMLEKAELQYNLDLYYVTRAYFTRHGAGPLSNELEGLPYPDVKDATNIPNNFQDKLRFAYIDIDILKTAINNDYNYTKSGSRSHLIITCADQLYAGVVKYYKDQKIQELPIEAFAKMLTQYIGVQDTLVSFGPSRDKIFPLPNQLSYCL